MAARTIASTTRMVMGLGSTCHDPLGIWRRIERRASSQILRWANTRPGARKSVWRSTNGFGLLFAAAKNARLFHYNRDLRHAKIFWLLWLFWLALDPWSLDWSIAKYQQKDEKSKKTRGVTHFCFESTTKTPHNTRKHHLKHKRYHKHIIQTKVLCQGDP